MSRLINYLPTYERNSKVFQEILKAEEVEFDKLDFKLKDLEKQFTVDTATWGLVIYEKELRLPINPNKSLEDRRSIIKAKMRGTGKVDYIMIKTIVEAFTSNIVKVGFDGKINILFTNQDKIPLNNKDMFNAIDEIKPAHLDYDFTSRHDRELQLKTSYREYPIPYLMCGTFLCGTKPYIQNQGISISTGLNVNTNKIQTSQKYKITGTFKSGEAKL